jgi:hypothetical protein
MPRSHIEPLYPVKTEAPPREILALDFRSLGEPLPITGGWGYGQGDACVIGCGKHKIEEEFPLDYVQIEYLFVEKRIYEEMIIFRSAGQRFAGITWTLQDQHLIRDAASVFDKLVFTISALNELDWANLRAEYEGAGGFGSPDFDEVAHEVKRREATVHFTRDFWFDITNCFGARRLI